MGFMFPETFALFRPEFVIYCSHSEIQPAKLAYHGLNTN